MTSLSKSFRLSSTLKIEEEAMAINKNQGISSILNGSYISDERSNKSSSSLRRTLSADMSSTKWLTQQGMKKIASSEEFAICSITDPSSSEGEEDEDDVIEAESRSQSDIWSSIQEDKEKKEEEEQDEKSGQFDIWSSIIQAKSQEITDNKPLPPPYIHPLVKRSSSLSEKSLQICTESLGSETGSDGFSSYPASESGDVIEDEKETGPEQYQVGQSFENFHEDVFIPKYNYVATAAKKSPPRSFPPPIPSLRGDGACIRMQPRRDNGRLVLEAVSVPSTNNFLAQRHDGRLVLTFVNSFPSTEVLRIEQEEKNKEVAEFEEEFETSSYEEDKESDDDDDEEEEEEEEETEEEDEGESIKMEGEKERALVMEQAPKLSSRVINLHRLTLKSLRNIRNSTWADRFNEVVKFDEVEDDVKTVIVAKSLPPMVRLIPKPSATAVVATGKVTAAAAGGGGGTSLNAYEYYWRRPKPMMTMTTTTTNSEGNILSKNSNQDQQQLLVLRGNKGDYLVPLVKSCKESRRSLLFWGPNCIATS